MPTVIAGSALDIVEHCGVPRFLFTDFPLGNPCGKPWDRDMQLAIVRQALELLVDAPGPRTTVQTTFEWSDDPSWRANYSRVGDDNRDEIRLLGERRRQRRAQQAKRK